MNVKSFILLLFLASFSASAQLQTNFPVTLTNLSGKVYSDITLDHTNAVGIVYTTQDGGMGCLKYTQLSADILSKYNIPLDVVQDSQAREDKAKAFWEAKAKSDAVALAEIKSQLAAQVAAQKAAEDASNAALKAKQDAEAAAAAAAAAPPTEEQRLQAIKEGKLEAIKAKSKRDNRQ